MRAFNHDQRVRVNEAGHPLNGITGTVRRLRMKDDAAWVEMDERPDGPDKPFPFPANDEHGRGNCSLLWPEECEAL